MDAPKCKVCQNRHWGTCYSGEKKLAPVILHSNPPLHTMKPATRKAVQAVARVALERMAADPDAAAKGKRQQEKLAEVREAAKKRGRPATGFDKKAYDREKARERRAAKKGKPDGAT